MRILLDTNAYSELKRGRASIANLLRQSERVYFSSIVVGELLFGFRCGGHYTKNRADLEDFLGRGALTLLTVGVDTADRFGRIAASLRKRGTPLPTNDIWIAAHAMESGAELVSFDRHFAEIDGIAHLYPEP